MGSKKGKGEVKELERGVNSGEMKTKGTKICKKKNLFLSSKTLLFFRGRQSREAQG